MQLADINYELKNSLKECLDKSDALCMHMFAMFLI